MFLHTKYFLKRLLLVPLTFFGITLLTFFIVNLAPGGPIDQVLQRARLGNSKGAFSNATSHSGVVISSETLEALKKEYGFDKPVYRRYFDWLYKILTADFGKSFIYGRDVLSIIKDRLPVSLQFGLFSFFLSYCLAIPLGLMTARRAGTFVDESVRSILLGLSAVPSFIFAIVLLNLFATDQFLGWFPLGYMLSEGYENMSFWQKVGDRVYHFILPLSAYTLGSLAGLTLITRNSILEQKTANYVRTARSLGFGENIIFSRYILKNALIPVLTGIGGFLSIFLAGSLLIETIFNLNGIGLLGYQALLTRDYNIIMALAVFQSIAMLLGNILNDIVYVIVDPRIQYGGV